MAYIRYTNMIWKYRTCRFKDIFLVLLLHSHHVWEVPSWITGRLQIYFQISSLLSWLTYEVKVKYKTGRFDLSGFISMYMRCDISGSHPFKVGIISSVKNRPRLDMTLAHGMKHMERVWKLKTSNMLFCLYMCTYKQFQADWKSFKTKVA